MRDNKAKSFVTIMIIVAVCALLLRIVIGRLIRLNIAQNESQASVALKLISAALENYAKDNAGIFPASLSVLAKTKPPYLDRDYTEKSVFNGYNYSCPRMDNAGYSCYATPTRCKISGNMIYTITTGSLLVSENCERKE